MKEDSLQKETGPSQATDRAQRLVRNQMLECDDPLALSRSCVTGSEVLRW
jgi:hypothetical protein